MQNQKIVEMEAKIKVYQGRLTNLQQQQQNTLQQIEKFKKQQPATDTAGHSGAQPLAASSSQTDLQKPGAQVSAAPTVYRYFVKLKHVPYNVVVEDIKGFLKMEILDAGDFAFCFDEDGLFLRCVNIRLQTEYEQKCVLNKNKQVLWNKIITVVSSNEEEWLDDYNSQTEDPRCPGFVSKQAKDLPSDSNPIKKCGFIRLKGIPVNTMVKTVQDAIQGWEIMENGVRMIHYGCRQSGHCLIVISQKELVMQYVRSSEITIANQKIEILISNYKQYFYLIKKDFTLKFGQKKILLLQSRSPSEEPSDPPLQKQPFLALNTLQLAQAALMKPLMVTGALASSYLPANPMHFDTDFTNLLLPPSTQPIGHIDLLTNY